MEPGHEDREYAGRHGRSGSERRASMEPGHEDREYLNLLLSGVQISTPQWSPVMKTGNTVCPFDHMGAGTMPQWSPVMKTGNTTATTATTAAYDVPQWSPVMKTGNTARRLAHVDLLRVASMEPGHEDREYHRLKGHPS